MKNNPTYLRFQKMLSDNLSLLPDKPEETVESTLSALWFFAVGEPVSAEMAVTKILPELSDKQENVLERLVDKRIKGVPLAYITGRQQFMGVELIANQNALIPRKETEILGNAVLSIFRDLSLQQQEIVALDLCCGAGNLAVALCFHVPEVTFYASDLSEDAVELTRQNIGLHRMEKRIHPAVGSVLSAFDKDAFNERFDVIVCNPPYISNAKVPNMPSEISEHEPEMAFNGGILGINVIRELIRNAPGFLKTNGWLAFEVGLGQGDFVKQLCSKMGLYRKITSVNDQLGNIRVILAQK